LLVFLGLFIFALVDADRGPVWTFIGIILCLVFGSALTGLAL
jgi:hypothetical protein